MASLSISTAWNETASFIKREAGLILPVALLLLAVPGAALQLVMPAPAAPGAVPEGGLWLLLVPVVMVASLVGTLAISHLALRPGTTVGEGLQAGMRRFLPLLLASILIGIAALLILVPLVLLVAGGSAASGNPAAAGAAVLLLVPLIFVVAIAFWVRLMLMTPVAAAEDVGPIGIIRRSWELTRGHFWKLVGLVLLLFFVAMVVMFAITAIVGIFVIMMAGQPDPGSTSFVLMTIVSALISGIFSAILMVLLTRIYVQLSGSVPTDVFA